MADPANPTKRGQIEIFATSAGPLSAAGGSTDTTVSGGFCGDEERVSIDVCNSLFPAVTFDKAGNIGIAWHDNKDGNYEIYLRLLQSRLDPSKLALASSAVDPVTGKPLVISCPTLFGSGTSGNSGVSGSSGSSGTLSNVLATQSGGRLDVNSVSRTMVLTVGAGTKDFQSMGATVNSAITILNGLNSGQTFFIQSISAPNVAQLVFVDGAKSDFGFLYSVNRSDAPLSTDEVRLTCNPSSSLFPDIIADKSGRFHIVYQDDAEGHFELYYIQVYPKAIGLKSCTGGTNTPPPITAVGFSPVPPDLTPQPTGSTPTQILIIVNNPTPSLVAFPVTGVDGAFFSFGDKTLTDPTPNNFGPVLNQTGIHKIFKDVGRNEWTGISLAADRDTWNQQAAAAGITVAPDYIGQSNNPLAGVGDFGTQFTFSNVAWIAQTPPDKDVEITLVGLPLHPRCLPPLAASTDTPDYQDLISAPKEPLPPGFVDPVDLSDVLTSPLATIDQNVPPRFTIAGDSSGTVFTNVLTDNGRGDLSRFVFTCDASRQPDEVRFILGQRQCGQELCALPSDAPGNPDQQSSQQYKITLQVWQGPDYRLIPNQNLSAQMLGATKLIEKDFYFDPGEDITSFSFNQGELAAADGRFLFFVPIAGPNVEFEVVGVGNGHEIWSTNSDGTFDQYYVPFTLQPNAGMTTPVYYEGILTEATSGVTFYPPGTNLIGDCTAAAALPTDSTIDIAFNSNNTNDVLQINSPLSTNYVYNAQAAISGQNTNVAVLPNALLHPELYYDPTHLGWPVLTQSAFVAANGSSAQQQYQSYLNFVDATFIQPQLLNPNTTLIPSGFHIPGNNSTGTLIEPAGTGTESQAFSVSQGISLKNVSVNVTALFTGGNELTGIAPTFGQPATITATIFPADASGNPIGAAVGIGTIVASSTGTISIPVCSSLQAGNYVLSISSSGAQFQLINRLQSDPVIAGAVANNTTGAASTGTPGTTTDIIASGVVIGSQILIGGGSVTPAYNTYLSALFNLSNSTLPLIPTQSPIDPNQPPNPNVPPVASPPTTPDPSAGATGGTGTGDITDLIATVPIKLTTSSGDSVHPRLAIDNNDNIFCVFHSNRTGADEVYVGRYTGTCGQWNTSNQGGSDFKLTSAGDKGHVAQFPEDVCDDQGNVHIVYQSDDTEDSKPEIFYVRSTNSGNSFLKPKRLTASPQEALMPAIAISSPTALAASTGCAGTLSQTVTGPGQVIVVWHDNRFGNYEILSASKINGVWTSSGQGGADTRVTQAAGNRFFPRVTADSRGNVRAVYHDSRRGEDNVWIYMSTFVASASAWNSSGQGGADLAVTPRGTDNSKNPDLDIDPLNGVAIVWHDTRFQKESPDQHEEIMLSYCPKIDAPLGVCGPICTNVESFLSTQFNIISCTTGNTITVTNVPNVCLNITSPGATFYRVQNDGGDFSSWTPFVAGNTLDSTQVPWVLGPGSGSKTVCVQVQDATTVGFPVCQTITLLSSPPTFQIEFFKDIGLTNPLPQLHDHPVATSGDIYVRLTSSVPLVKTPTFDVINKGTRIIIGQPTIALSGASGFSGSASGFSGSSGFSGNAIQPFIGQDATTSLGVTGFSALAGNVFIGRFQVFRDDGLFHIDGNARLIPHGKDARGQNF